MSKKLLSEILHERMDSVIYRKIKKTMFQLSESKKFDMLILPANIDDYAITRFQNEGITVTKIIDFGHEKYKLSWPKE